MATQLPLIIVGASYAGTQLAASARELGFDAPIVIVGDEPHAPYQRPPLSKGLLTGKATAETLSLRGPEFFSQNDITLQLGVRATVLDAATRRLQLADGSSLGYGWLALTTGARWRPLTVPGADLAGVYPLRTLDEALRLADAMTGASRACVIGGGYIGLEAAAALAGRGIATTVVEFQPRLLARSAPPVLASYVAEAHTRRGVQLRLGRAVQALQGVGRVEAVLLDDGSRIDCDIVVLGVGVLPNTELAMAAGAAVDNGILTDGVGHTSLPQVLAAGDVANMVLPTAPGGPERLRLESIQAANDGARAAASALVGRPHPCTAVPWFWSDQFDLKLQMAGLTLPGDETVLRGELDGDRFTLFQLRDGVVVASQSVNRPAEHMVSRKLIAAGTRVSGSELRDTSFDLKSLVSTPRSIS